MDVSLLLGSHPCRLAAPNVSLAGIYPQKTPLPGVASLLGDIIAVVETHLLYSSLLQLSAHVTVL
jgi:hypothetical protein